MISLEQVENDLINAINNETFDYDTQMPELEVFIKEFLDSNGYKVTLYKVEDVPWYWIDIRISCIDPFERGVFITLCLVKRIKRF